MTGHGELRARAFRFLASADERRDAAPLYRRLLAETAPLAVEDRSWLVSRYDDVTALLGDDRWTVELDAAEPFLPAGQPAGLDAGAAAQLRPQVEAAVDELLEPALARGSLDVVADLARPLPVLVSCAMLAVPPADRHLLLEWATRLGDGRRGLTRGGLLDHLFAAADGGRLRDEELVAFAVLLLLNGLETTTNALGNAVWTLLATPGALTWLDANPGGAGAAFDECLRLAGPVRLAARRVREAVPVAGRRMERGDTVVLLLAAANRDPSRFPEPDAFRPGRPGRHLAFGHGPHLCPGAALARQQGEVVLDRLFRRHRVETSLSEADAPWKPSLPLLGLSALPVRFRSSAAGAGVPARER